MTSTCVFVCVCGPTLKRHSQYYKKIFVVEQTVCTEDFTTKRRNSYFWNTWDPVYFEFNVLLRAGRWLDVCKSMHAWCSPNHRAPPSPPLALPHTQLQLTRCTTHRSRRFFWLLLPGGRGIGMFYSSTRSLTHDTGLMSCFSCTLSGVQGKQAGRRKKLRTTDKGTLRKRVLFCCLPT